MHISTVIGLVAIISTRSIASVAALCDQTQSEFQLTIKLDQYPTELSWYLFDYGYTQIASGAFDAKLAHQTVMETVCFHPRTPDCYFFEIDDSSRDGICCKWGEGSYSYKYSSSIGKTKAISVKRSGDFKAVDVTNFGDCGLNPLPLDRLPDTKLSVTNADGRQLTFEYFYNSIIVLVPFEIAYINNGQTGVTDIDYDFGSQYFVDTLYLKTWECSRFDDLRVIISKGDNVDKDASIVYNTTLIQGTSEHVLEIPVRSVGRKLRIEVVNGANLCSSSVPPVFTSFGFYYVYVDGYKQSPHAFKSVKNASGSRAPKSIKASKLPGGGSRAPKAYKAVKGSKSPKASKATKRSK